ncbi:FGGY-family carbohydrate kinase [Oceaniglobus ichthyenteri]|uniref:FGGY-family carbohydrate kinase n=1 Tax=Oceaniglobus ichthyenteri TaxID=2136177 RepID=UPI000D36D679|nr:FGGY-family carbohydrate kinase [Oceaniglobus ichthyenteri]
MARILAIDSGLTVTKAVVFDTAGRQLGVVRRNVRQIMPGPRRVERDMMDLWHQTADAIREVLADSGTHPSDILAVAATAHGDGIYLLDQQGAPLGNAILSLDSRAADVIGDWHTAGIDRESLALTGQMPHVSAPSALLAWIQREEPERFGKIAHVMACKDWLRYCLTDSIGTDRTEASTSFTDMRTQNYTPDALALFGLQSIAPALPDVAHSAEIIGTVSEAASAQTGLAQGTPVAAGLHDVTASVLGIGGHTPGVMGIVAGTYSINEAVSDTPTPDARWFCRNGVRPGVWNNMAISPASTTNYDWFLDTFCATDRANAERRGQTIHALLAPEIDDALARASSAIYHPFLFGSPYGAAASAGFFGLRGWHNRGDILAALLEGIVFNHRHHIDALRATFPTDTARLTGGAARNPVVAQLFADILGMQVATSATDEAAAWGAALCAGAAVGAFAQFDADPRDLDAISTTYHPRPDRVAEYETRYAAYQNLADILPDTWDRLNTLEAKGRRTSND